MDEKRIELKYGENIELKGHRCYRCGHAWLPRNSNDRPKVCPKCKSPYWNKPKKN